MGKLIKARLCKFVVSKNICVAINLCKWVVSKITSIHVINYDNTHFYMAHELFANCEESHLDESS